MSQTHITTRRKLRKKQRSYILKKRKGNKNIIIGFLLLIILLIGVFWGKIKGAYTRLTCTCGCSDKPVIKPVSKVKEAIKKATEPLKTVVAPITKPIAKAIAPVKTAVVGVLPKKTPTVRTTNSISDGGARTNEINRNIKGLPVIERDIQFGIPLKNCLTCKDVF